MILLFDENLSPTLVERLADLFLGSTHVHTDRLSGAEDSTVWSRARNGGMVVVTKDIDFVELAAQNGPPPKLIVVTLGNCTTRQVESLLWMRIADVEAFGRNPDEAVLFLP
jgi:predicted nuclease of predicted toxin-antitoxin system